MTAFSQKLRTIIAGVLALLLIGYLWIESFYMRIIPAEIGISYPLARGGVSDFREGCGAAVLRCTGSIRTPPKASRSVG